MLTPHILITSSIIITSSAVQLPVHEVITFVDKELTVMEFIRSSYQPLLITDALQQTTLDNLTPWTFPALRSSLEAATTFCTASARPSTHFDDDTEGGEAPGEDKDVPMSLRRFGMEGAADSRWLHALTTLTKELGMAVTLPGVLMDADLAFLDLTKTGLRHSRSGWAGLGVGGSAVVVCVVEGVLSFTLTPLPPSLAPLQCVAGQCEAAIESQQLQDVPPELAFLTRATAHPGTCLYAPPRWQWSAAALEDSAFLIFGWEDDLVIKEDVVEDLFPEEDATRSRSEGTRRGRGAGTLTLWEALPKGSSPPSLLLWGSQNPLLHLLRRYLLTDRHLRLESFVQEFRVDRLLMPDLVDCPEECVASAGAIFDLLDADGDGELTPADATLLSPASFASLTHQMDDFMDELKDVAREQWEEAVEGPAEARSAFLQRAKDRLTASATATVQRWVAGDLEGVDEEALKEHFPSLHEQVSVARRSAAPQDREEL